MSRACSCSVWQWQRIVVYVLLHDYVNVRVCNLHNPHHTSHIENHKQHTADSQLVATNNYCKSACLYELQNYLKPQMYNQLRSYFNCPALCGIYLNNEIKSVSISCVSSMSHRLWVYDSARCVRHQLFLLF